MTSTTCLGYGNTIGAEESPVIEKVFADVETTFVHECVVLRAE